MRFKDIMWAQIFVPMKICAVDKNLWTQYKFHNFVKNYLQLTIPIVCPITLIYNIKCTLPWPMVVRNLGDLVCLQVSGGTLVLGACPSSGITSFPPSLGWGAWIHTDHSNSWPQSFSGPLSTSAHGLVFQKAFCSSPSSSGFQGPCKSVSGSSGLSLSLLPFLFYPPSHCQEGPSGAC